jgi:hypothetical protein
MEELDKVIKAERLVDLWVTKEISDDKRDELVTYVLENGSEAFKRSKLLKDVNMGREMAEELVV